MLISLVGFAACAAAYTLSNIYGAKHWSVNWLYVFGSVILGYIGIVDYEPGVIMLNGMFLGISFYNIVACKLYPTFHQLLIPDKCFSCDFDRTEHIKGVCPTARGVFRPYPVVHT